MQRILGFRKTNSGISSSSKCSRKQYFLSNGIRILFTVSLVVIYGLYLQFNTRVHVYDVCVIFSKNALWLPQPYTLAIFIKLPFNLFTCINVTFCNSIHVDTFVINIIKIKLWICCVISFKIECHFTNNQMTIMGGEKRSEIVMGVLSDDFSPKLIL